MKTPTNDGKMAPRDDSKAAKRTTAQAFLNPVEMSVQDFLKKEQVKVDNLHERVASDTQNQVHERVGSGAQSRVQEENKISKMVRIVRGLFK